MGHVHPLPCTAPSGTSSWHPHIIPQSMRVPWWTIPEEDRLHMRAVEAAPKQSETCPPPQPRAHLPLQTTPAPNNCGRRPHCCCGEGRARPHQTQPERRHLPPKVPTRPILHRKTGTQIWPRPVADACSLCGLHDSCTHVAGECHAHKSQIISKHNVACLLIHTAIRKPFKGGGTLHSPHTLRLVSADAGTKTQTPGVLMANTYPPPTRQQRRNQSLGTGLI